MGSHPENPPDIEGFLCACLRGEQPAWPFGRDESAITQFMERAEYHGVLALLHDRLQRAPASGWPPGVLQACRQGALAQAMWELRHRALLTEAFAKLAAAGVVPVVFKGTALAYTLYPEGALRSRGDTDFIIPPGSQNSTAEILASLGFEHGLGMSGESVSYEASFTRSEPGGGSHTLDVHWKINNSELLSRLFTHAELLAASQPIPALGPHARAAGPVHALLIACMHRATHKHNPYYVNGVAYHSGDRLIWLYDIHLLAGTFTPEQWIEFVRLAEQKGLCAVCLEGLERARTSFGTLIPASVQALLARPGGSEKVARYFSASALRQQWMNFCAIPGIMRKLRFVGETVFPSADYMREKYPEGGWLPWLYLRRALGGVAKRLQHMGGGS
jgi:hypothetical protein